MKRLLLLMMILFVQHLNAQTFTEDFEDISLQGCTSSEAFNQGCIDGWIATHGTANIINESNGNTHARMSINTTNCTNGGTRSEGIALEYDFLPGVSYSLTFRTRTKYHYVPDFKVSLANGLTNDLDDNSMVCPPSFISTVEVAQLDGNTSGYGTSWHEFSITIPASDQCYTQLWFRPYTSGGYNEVSLDDIEITPSANNIFTSQFIWNSGELCTYWLEAIDFPDDASYQWYHTGNASVVNPNSAGTMVTIPSGETSEICLEVSFDNNPDCIVMECAKLSCPTICEIPTGLQASSVDGTYFNTLIDWNDISTPLQFYELNIQNVTTGQGGIYNTNSSKKLLKKLEACTEYRARVRAQCQLPGNTSEWSDWIYFSTYCAEVCWEIDDCQFNNINNNQLPCNYNLNFSANYNLNVTTDIQVDITYLDGSTLTTFLNDAILSDGSVHIEFPISLGINPLSIINAPNDVCITIDYSNGQEVYTCLEGLNLDWQCYNGNYSLGKSKGKDKSDLTKIKNTDNYLENLMEGFPKSINADVYPNPLDNQLWISLDNENESNYNIQLFNSVGKLIKTKTVANPQEDILINTEELISGFYIVKITNDDGIGITQKIIKN